MNVGKGQCVTYEAGAEPWSHVAPLPKIGVVLSTRARKMACGSAFFIVILGMMGRCASSLLSARLVSNQCLQHV